MFIRKWLPSLTYFGKLDEYSFIKFDFYLNYNEIHCSTGGIAAVQGKWKECSDHLDNLNIAKQENTYAIYDAYTNQEFGKVSIGQGGYIEYVNKKLNLTSCKAL